MLQTKRNHRIVVAIVGVLLMLAFLAGLGHHPMDGLDSGSVEYVIASHSAPNRFKVVRAPEQVDAIVRAAQGLRASYLPASEHVPDDGHVEYEFHKKDGSVVTLSVTSPMASFGGRAYRVKHLSDQPLYEVFGTLDGPAYDTYEQAADVVN